MDKKSQSDSIQVNEQESLTAGSSEAIHFEEQEQSSSANQRTTSDFSSDSNNMAAEALSVAVKGGMPHLPLDSINRPFAAVAPQEEHLALLEHSNHNHKRAHGYIDVSSTSSPEARHLPIAKRTKRETSGMDVTIETNSSGGGNQWHAMYERLVDYKARKGNTLVPKRYKEDPKLGTWVETQRVQYKRLERTIDPATGQEHVIPNTRLTAERLQLLNSIEFAWSAKFVRRGPKAAASPRAGGAPAGGTVSRAVAQPTRHSPAVASDKKKRRIEQEQLSASQRSAGGRSKNDHWEEMYQRLVSYQRTHGDCLVPKKYTADPKLASWVENQRVLWNREVRLALAAQETERQIEKERTSDAPQAPLTAGSQLKWLTQGNVQKSDETAAMAARLAEDDIVAAAAMIAMEAADPSIICGPSSTEVTPAQTPPGRFLAKERKEKLDQIGFVWSLRKKQIDDHWDGMFAQLCKFKATHGDCIVPSRYEENLKLGKWVETQRYEYNKLQRTRAQQSLEEPPVGDSVGISKKIQSRLTDERIKKLESIGFEWKVRNKMKRYYDKQWHSMFQRLVDFKKIHGHTLVPKRFGSDPKLGTWVHTQRIQYRKMINGTKAETNDIEPPSETNAIPSNEELSFRLTEERRKILEEIGFVWSTKDAEKQPVQPKVARSSYDDLWDANFKKLLVFREKHGHCLVPKRYPDDPKLGTWVDTQRVLYKRRVKMQNSVHGDCAPESQGMTDTGASSTKINVGRLTDERIQRLEAVGFVWSLRDDWMKHYEELKAYKANQGDCNVPARYVPNRKLGIWVSAQRQQYKILQNPSLETKKKSNSLTPERIGLLEELGFSWSIRSRDTLGESWNLRFAQLQEYHAKFGNCLVPSRYPPLPELGVWVGTQRTQYRLYQAAKDKGQEVAGVSSMNEQRIQLLESIGFIWFVRGQDGGRRGSSTHGIPYNIEFTPLDPDQRSELSGDEGDEANSGAHKNSSPHDQTHDDTVRVTAL